MSMSGCTHRVAGDHIAGRDAEEGARIWRCSLCGAEDSWREGWRYYGNIECKRCSQAQIDRVECPKCAALPPAKAQVTVVTYPASADQE